MDLTVLGIEANLAAILTIIIWIAFITLFIVIAFKIMRYFQRAEQRDIEKIEIEKQKLELAKKQEKHNKKD